MIDDPDLFRATKLVSSPGDNDLSALQDAITVWTARHVRCFQNRLGFQLGAPNVTAIDVITVNDFGFWAPGNGNDEFY
jgi:hypothetical protein